MQNSILVGLKKITLLSFVLVLLSTAVVVVFVRPVVAQVTNGTIYIKSDGSVEGTDKIQRDGNIYTFTDNIVNQSIIVERDNIVVDGAGYILQGTEAFGSVGIDLTGRKNITIKNMKIRAFRFGIHLNESSTNNIYGNNITNNVSGVLLEDSSNNSISGNTIINNNLYGIGLYACSNNTISGNNITKGGSGIDLCESSNNTINEDNITNNVYGIHLRWPSNHNTISGNNIANSRYGIQLSRSSNYNSIYGNNVTNNWDGICLDSSSNNGIYGNNVADNEDGIELVYSSDYNGIYGNNITNNGNGISLSRSSNNGIYGNNVTNNGEGICFWNSSSNKFYHNNFIGNTQQVRVVELGDIPMSAYTNFWDDGVSEGNYWSDYEDRYLNAEEIDESGIWNTPYVINENNQDNYPLISPWGKIPEEEIPFWMQWWLWAIVALVVVALAGAVYFLKKRKPPTLTTSTLPAQKTNSLKQSSSFPFF